MAFWNGRSRGTLNTLILATCAGLPVEVFGPEGEAVDLRHALGVAKDGGVYDSIAAGEARTAKSKRAEEL